MSPRKSSKKAKTSDQVAVLSVTPAAKPAVKAAGKKKKGPVEADDPVLADPLPVPAPVAVIAPMPVPAPAAMPVPVPTEVDPSAFDDFDTPDQLKEYGKEIVKILCKMPNTKKGKGTLLPASYTRTTYNKLTYGMRKKCVQTWIELSKEVKDEIMRTIMAAAVTKPQNEIVQGTNKHDRARLLHLFCDPALTAIWTAMVQVKDRLELDDKEHPADFAGRLADAFNDYEAYPYRNETVQFDEDGVEAGPVAGMDVAYGMCSEINPAAGLTTRPLRDGNWIVTHFRNFKASWAVVFDNYTRSGLGEMESPAAEFQMYCAGDEILMYAFVLFRGEDGARLQELMGKLLPDYAAQDTGVLGTPPARVGPHIVRTANRARAGSASSVTATPASRTIVLDIPALKAGNDRTEWSDFRQDEKDELDVNLRLTESSAPLTLQIRADALEAIAAIQKQKKQRREASSNP